MRINPIESGAAVIQPPEVTAAQVRENLEKLAERHHVSVDELLASAHAAGPGGPSYLVRALNLEARLQRLEQQ